MSTTTDSRPSQATLGGWMIVSGSVLLVVSLFSTMAELRSLDTRRSVEEMLAEPPLDSSGISVTGFLDLLHATALVSGACAAAMAVLGVYALRRHRPARVWLGVLAVPLFLAGLVAGGLLSSVVAVSVALLWVRPSRDWFDGTPREVPAEPAPAGDERPVPPGPGTTTGDAGAPERPVDAPWSRPLGDGETSGAEPYRGYGAPTGAATDTLPRPWGAPAQTGPPGAAQGRAERGPRPGAVLAACVSTWLFSFLVAAAMLVGAYEALANPDALLGQVTDQQREAFAQSGLGQDLVVTATAVLSGVLAVWALGAALLAVLTFRGSPGPRIGLVVSAALALVVSFGAGFLAPVAFLVTIACALTLVCLARPEVRAWYAADRGGMGR